MVSHKIHAVWLINTFVIRFWLLATRKGVRALRGYFAPL